MSNNIKAPYLSIIMSSRNDNYGGNLKRQVEVIIGSLIEQLERYKLESEIILVDYNPPHDRPLLKDALEFPKHTEYCTIRTIVVPASIHSKKYKDASKLPFDGVVAKNAGLRRARGNFVMMTNGDILYSNELIEILAKKRLQVGKIYKTDKYDVPGDVLGIQSLEDRLAFCRKEVVCIAIRYGFIIVSKGKKYPITEELRFGKRSQKLQMLHTGANDFLLMSKEHWHFLHGYPELGVLGLGSDGIFYYMAYLSGIKEEILKDPCRTYHLNVESRWRATNPSLMNKAFFYCLPYSTAIKIRWYFRLFINGLVLRIFINGNVLEISRLYPIYWSNLIGKILGKKTKVDIAGVKSRTWAEMIMIMNKMRNRKRSIAFNDENWGLGNESLDEYTIVKADWEIG